MQSQLQSFESSTLGSLGKIELGFQSLGGAASQILQTATGVSLGNIFTSAITKATEAVSAAAGLVEQGVAYNAELEQSKVAIAALLQGTTQLTDNEGKKLSATASWTANLQEAAKLQTTLADMSASTLGTQKELLDVFSTALAYSRGQKASVADILTFSQGILNVGKLQGLNGERLIAETRQILQLNQITGQQILPLLGYSITQARNFKAQGDEIQKLNEKFATYKDLAAASETTWLGLTTNAQTFVSLVSANTFTETFGGAKEIVAGFSQEMIKLQKDGDLTVPLLASDTALRQLGATGADVFAKLLQGTAKVTNSILEMIASTEELVSTNEDVKSWGSQWQIISYYFIEPIGILLTGINDLLLLLGRSFYDLANAAVDAATIIVTAFGTLPAALVAAGAALTTAKNPLDAYRATVKVWSDEQKIAVEDMEFRWKRMTGQIAATPPPPSPFHQNLFGVQFKPEDPTTWGEKTPWSAAIQQSEARAKLFPKVAFTQRTGLPGPDAAADAAAKRREQALRNLKEQIPELAARNAALREAIAANLSLDEAQSRATASALAQKAGDAALAAQFGVLTAENKKLIEVLKAKEEISQLAAKNVALQKALTAGLTTAQAQAQAVGDALAEKTGSKELGEQLTKQTELHKNLTDAQNLQTQAQERLAASSLALPQVLTTVTTELAKKTPWKQIEDKIKEVEGAAKITTTFATTGQSPAIAIAAQTQSAQNEQAKNRAVDAGQFFDQTRKGLQDSIAADRTRIAVMREDATLGKSYERTQLDIANALELLKLKQDAYVHSLTETQQAELADLAIKKQKQAEAADLLARQQELANQIATDISDAFLQMSQNISNAFEIMRSTVLGIVNDIAKEILRRQVVNPLAKLINDWLDKIFNLGKPKEDKVIQANNVYVNGVLVDQGPPADASTIPWNIASLPIGSQAGTWGEIPGLPLQTPPVFDANQIDWQVFGGAATSAAPLTTAALPATESAFTSVSLDAGSLGTSPFSVLQSLPGRVLSTVTSSLTGARNLTITATTVYLTGQRIVTPEQPPGSEGPGLPPGTRVPIGSGAGTWGEIPGLPLSPPEPFDANTVDWKVFGQTPTAPTLPSTAIPTSTTQGPILTNDILPLDIRGVFTSISGGLTNIFSRIFSAGSSLFSTISSGLSSLFSSLFSSLTGSAGGASSGTSGGLTSLISSVFGGGTTGATGGEASSSFLSGIPGLFGGSKGAAGGADPLSGVGGLISSLVGNVSGLLGSLTSGIGGLLSSLLGGAGGLLSGLTGGLGSLLGGAGGSGLFSSILSLGAFFIHDGGVAGSGMTRNVSASVFHSASRYHSGGMVGTESTSFTMQAPAQSEPLVQMFHWGGTVATTTNTPSKTLSSSVMAQAPKYHTGLMPREIPAILEEGEAVIPRRSMQSLSPQGKAMIHAIIKGVSFHTGGTVGAEGTPFMIQTSTQKEPLVQMFHWGGTVATTTNTPSKTLSSSVIAQASKYHTGGTVGTEGTPFMMNAPAQMESSVLMLHWGGTVAPVTRGAKRMTSAHTIAAAQRFHAGRMPTGMSMTMPRLFVNAPRLHDGLQAGVAPSVVFTNDRGSEQTAVDGGRHVTIIQNIQTQDLAGFRQSADMLARDQRIHQEIAYRRFA